MKRINSGKFRVVFDEEHYRVSISPLMEGNSMPVDVFLSQIRANLGWTWRATADFFGLASQNRVFRAAYRSNKKDISLIAPYEVIDVSNNVAYFYDKDHLPQQIEVPHVGPSISNEEPATQKIKERIPAKIAGRITVLDTLNRQLTMRLKPTGGYLLGVSAANLANPNQTYQVSGSKSGLNNILRKLYFVAISAGKAKLSIIVDDGAGKTNSAVSTEVNLTVEATPSVSIPVIKAPESVDAIIDDITPIKGITITDADKKLLSMSVTPFNCEVFGFKGNISIFKQGEVRYLSGLPEDLTADLANLKVRALGEAAQIGIGIVVNNTKVRQWIRINGITVEEDEENPSLLGSTSNPSVQTQSVSPKNASSTTNTTATTSTTSTSPKSGKGITTTTTTSSTKPAETTTEPKAEEPVATEETKSDTTKGDKTETTSKK